MSTANSCGSIRCRLRSFRTFMGSSITAAVRRIGSTETPDSFQSATLSSVTMHLHDATSSKANSLKLRERLSTSDYRWPNWEESLVASTDTTNPKDLLGIKKCRLDLVPNALAISAAPAMLLGAQKYGPFNWREKDVRLTVYLGAIKRHVAAYEDGEEVDEESGYSHLGHAAACLAIIADAKAIGKLIDDRPLAGGAPAMMKEQISD